MGIRAKRNGAVMSTNRTEAMHWLVNHWFPHNICDTFHSDSRNRRQDAYTLRNQAPRMAANTMAVFVYGLNSVEVHWPMARGVLGPLFPFWFKSWETFLWHRWVPRKSILIQCCPWILLKNNGLHLAFKFAAKHSSNREPPIWFYRDRLAWTDSPAKLP